MTEKYPKSREEVLAENEVLLRQVKQLEAAAAGFASAMRAKDDEVAVLRRRKPIRVLDPKSTDKFSRPFGG